MNYFVKVFDEYGKKTQLYNKYGSLVSLRVDEQGTLKIPEGTYGYNGCDFLIQTNAERIECSYSSVSNLIANEAIYIDCNSCKINYIEAEKVKKIDCSNNSLDFLYLPQATDIICVGCKKLEEINAPKLVKLEASDCIFYDTEINTEMFPDLKTLEIMNTNVEVIEHSKLKKLIAIDNKIKKNRLSRFRRNTL